jgi:hypothetical protein
MNTTRETVERVKQNNPTESRAKALADVRARISEIEDKSNNNIYKFSDPILWENTLKSLKIKEAVLAKDSEVIDQGREELKALWTKLSKIEAKEKCLRVQFLDWLSDKLLDYSNIVHIWASKIDSPCIIEVAPRTKEESNHAKETKEINRLLDSLKRSEAENRELRAIKKASE